MTNRAFRRRRLKIPGKTLVRNERGIPILCAWDDCRNNGYDEIKVIVNEPLKKLHYIFCSEQHKRYHIHGHLEYGKKAP